MNSPLSFLLRPALALSAVFALSSCETYPGDYGAYGGDPGGYSGGGGYYSGGGGYVSRPYYGSGYGGGYYSSNYYRRYNNDRYDDHDHHDHRNDRDRDYRNDRDRHDRDDRNRKSSSDNDIRMTKYREGGKPSDLPTGYHSKEWYQQRGYSLSKNNYETRDGDPRGNANDSKKSKSDGGGSSKHDKKR